MRRRSLCLAALLALPAGTGPVAGAPPEAAAGVLVLTHGNAVDGATGSVLRDVTLVVAEGVIREVAVGTRPPVAGARVIDLNGGYVLPGLIDAHVHIRDADSARRALLSGVTTARSMGVDHFADLGLSALAAAGAIDAPELLGAGYHVQPKPSEALFIDMPEFADLMARGFHGPDALRRIARAHAGRGVRWIKVNATARAGLASADPREPFFDDDELRALVDEAGKSGIPVAAHAHGDEGGRAAARAGARSIEHGTYLSADTLAIMAGRGTYLVPTIAVVADMARPKAGGGDDFLQQRGHHMLPHVRRTVVDARRLGVRIVAGSDSDYGAASTLRLTGELEELAAAGLAPAEVLWSATGLAARLLGVDARTGHIAPGMEADLLVVERNPLEELTTVSDPVLVVSNGRIVRDRTLAKTPPQVPAYGFGSPAPPR